MDLIFTNARSVDQGVLSAYEFDLSYGAEENDFEIIIGANEPRLETGCYVYVEGTEYGGTVDGLKTSTNSEAITYKGRTWHGMMNSKVIMPNAGADYLVVSGEANKVLSTLIERLGLSGLFVANSGSSGITISNYRFKRYCKGYDGIVDMLAANGAKLKVEWNNRAVHISAKPIVDHSDAPVDGDAAVLTVERNAKKVNHLVCLGKGNLAEREVIHLYADCFGSISKVQYYKGLDEIADTYDNSNSEDLEADGIAKLKELRNTDIAEIDLPETEGTVYDIGDIVDATEYRTETTVTETVTQKIVKIKNGVVSIEYKTGG